ncbi:Uncharacterised protein [Escherichia coli]|nr:Uncharacterised protein [Escherichia coli]
MIDFFHNTRLSFFTPYVRTDTCSKNTDSSTIIIKRYTIFKTIDTHINLSR